ncbi:TPA: hypothetical protein MAL84_002778 [Klebsiella pneumoniae]|nr:hypothetical protein [Klebsiella pneumoniae]
MTTDITELALRLKLEAHRAVSNFNPQMNIKTRDLKDLLEALEKAQHTITEMDNRIRQQNRNVCELFDDGKALREQIAELESRTVTDWIEHDGKWRPDSLSTDELVYLKTRKQELKIPYPAGKVKGWMNTGGDMDVMAYKLASPQASTVTVKLPSLPRLGANTEWYQGFAAGAESMRSDCAHAINAAGIKVEAE